MIIVIRATENPRGEIRPVRRHKRSNRLLWSTGICRAVAVLSAAVWLGLSPAVRADVDLAAPMNSRNLSPLYANLGIPGMNSAAGLEKGEFVLDWTLHWASHSLLERSDGQTLALDGETRRQDLRVQVGLGQSAVLFANIPFMSHSGGNLDGLIDDWHAFWGMPDGPRAGQVSNRLRFAYTGPEAFDLVADRSGVGDSELGLSVEAVKGENWNLGIFAQYKFATGDTEDFTGSGDAGGSLGLRLRLRRCLFDQLSCHAQLGVSEVGDSMTDAKASQLVPFMGISLAWQLGSTVALLAQVDGHGVVYDADVLSDNGPPIWGTLGFRWRPANQWLLDAQFVEDLAVGSAPDVSFRFAVSRSF